VIAAGDTVFEAVELVRRGYAAFNAGDLGTVSRLVAERAAWHTPGQSPIAGDYVGRDAVVGHLGRYRGRAGVIFRAEPASVASGGGGTVVGIHRITGLRGGRRLDTRCCIVFQVRNGELVDAREHFFDLHAWDAFWS